MAGANTVVRLDYNGIANLVGKRAGIFKVIHDVVTGGGNTCLSIVLLHSRLILNLKHVCFLEAGSNMELGTQLCVTLQPVLIVGFQPVDLAVLVGKERNCTEYFIVVFQGIYLVVFMQSTAQFRQKIVIRAITNTQHTQTIVLQFSAELPVVYRKVRGNKNKILHSTHFLLFLNPADGGRSVRPSYTTRASCDPHHGPRNQR